MANSPFDWGDMFYWGTRRNGTPYPFFAKLIFLLKGNPLSPEIFYWVYISLILLTLSSIWLAPIHPLLSLLFIVLLLPMTARGIDLMLLPGQPYGSGLFFLALTLAGAIKRNPFLLFVGILFLFLVNSPLGVLGLATVLGFFLEDPGVWKKRIFPLVGLTLVGTATIYWFKSFATDDGFHWLDAPPHPEILISLKFLFLQNGLSLDGQGGKFGVVFFAGMIGIGIYTFLKNRTFYDRYWAILLTGWILSGLFFLGINRWFLANDRDPRYVEAVATGALAILVIITYKKLIPPPLLLIFLAVLIFLKEKPLFYQTLSEGRKIRNSAIMEEVKDLGCRGVLGDYWDSYFIVARSGMKILGSSLPYSSRNLAFYQKTLTQRPLCLVDSDDVNRLGEPFISQLNLQCPADGIHFLVRKCLH